MAIKIWPLTRPYQVVGEDTHPPFLVLPVHDHAALFTYLHRNMTTLKPAAMVDLQADIGAAALAFCDSVWRAPVLAFEPDPTLFGWLSETVALNGFDTRIHLSCAAATPDNVRDALAALGDAPPVRERVLVHSLSLLGPPRELGDLAPLDGTPACVFFRLNIGHATAAGLRIAAVLSEAEERLGPLGVVDEFSGMVSPLSSGPAGEAQLRAMERNPHEVFRLVNRLDIAALEERPPWLRPDLVAAKHGVLKSIQSSGEVVDDWAVAPDYQGAIVRSYPSRHWPPRMKNGGETSQLTVFPVKGAVVTSCYVSIDPEHGRLFGNQTYYEANLWFTQRPRISGDRYDFRSRNAVPLPGRTAVIGGPIDGVYYHWLLNWAPRIVLLDLLAPKIAADPEVKLLIDDRARKQPFAAFIDALGVDPARIVWAEERLDYALEEAIVVSFPSQVTYYPDLIKTFAERVRLGMGIVPGAGPRKRLWISRQSFDMPKRRIANMPDVEPLIRDYGFEVVALENLSAAEQVALFSNAEMVAGVHGAGLANLIFCPPDCKVVLMETDHNVKEGTAQMFTVLAEVMGLDHQVVRVKEHRLRGIDYSFRGNRHNCDVIVPHALLRAALRKLVGGISRD